MLRLQDCLRMCDLTDDEVDAIAKHEHVLAIVVAELKHYLLLTPDGQRRIERIILDNIAAVAARGDLPCALELGRVLRAFCNAHPECFRTIH